MSWHTVSPNVEREIQERLRRRFLDRLANKVKRIRRSLIERNWFDLRMECKQLRGSADSFGYPKLVELAYSVQEAIPENMTSKLNAMPDAQIALEKLIAAIDNTLIENGIPQAQEN